MRPAPTVVNNTAAVLGRVLPLKVAAHRDESRSRGLLGARAHRRASSESRELRDLVARILAAMSVGVSARSAAETTQAGPCAFWLTIASLTDAVTTPIFGGTAPEMTVLEHLPQGW